MSEIIFKPFEEEHKSQVKHLIKLLYQEDPEGEKISDVKINRTFSFLSENPNSGKIYSFIKNNDVIGYSILIHYWSNEYGAELIHIDELYIDQKHRNLKIGTSFIDFLKQEYSESHRAILLEVTPDNQNALRFYFTNNFQANRNKLLKLTL